MPSGSNSVFTSLAVGPVFVTFTPPGGTSLNIGLCEKGKVMRQGYTATDLKASEYGDEVIDRVITGGFCQLLLTVKEWRAGSKALLWPFSSTTGHAPQAGKIESDMSGVLVLTSVTGTTRNGNEFVTRTFGKCSLAPGNWNEMLDSDQNDIPIVLDCLRYLDSDASTWIYYKDA